jgi:hypothetical protein
MAQARGNEYLDEEFPELTRIIRVTVEEGADVMRNGGFI